MKTLQVDDDLHEKLLILKGVFVEQSMTATIRRIMNAAGYTPKFFARIRQMAGTGEYTLAPKEDE